MLGSLPQKNTIGCSTLLGTLQALIRILFRVKHSSLSCQFVSYGQNSFVSFVPVFRLKASASLGSSSYRQPSHLLRYSNGSKVKVGDDDIIFCRILYFLDFVHANGSVHIRCQCRKMTVLSCHRCLINIGVEKMNYS